MPTTFDFEDGELVDCYNLGEAECPVCGYPMIGHFKSGILVETEPCQVCVEKNLKKENVPEWRPCGGSTSAAEFWGHLMVYIVPSIFIRLFISNWNSPYGVMCP